MYEYFPDNYAWSLTTAMMFDEVGTFCEPDEILQKLKPVAGAAKSIANEEWHQQFTALAERIERLGMRDEAERHLLSAARKYHRAGLYYLRAERFMDHGDPREIRTYKKGIGLYRKARELARDPVEYVEIDFKGGKLPAIFIKAMGEGPRPCMVFLQGFDSLKEWFFPVIGTQFRERGVSLLVVDQPGAGGALRLYGLAGDAETEHPAGACVDYLETRKDVNKGKIGVMGVSLGGYYAPRAAAFEKRFKACICWGAIWDFSEHFERVMQDGRKAGSIPDMVKHAMWVFGQDTPEGAFKVAKQLATKHFAERIECPLFIVHGENDRQIPVQSAYNLYEAATKSAAKKLKLFTISEGGAEHCQTNNRTLAGDVMSDWSAETFGAAPNGAF